MRAQITLYDKKNKYRPVSTLIKIDSLEDFQNNKEKIKSKGIKKIMIQRGWTKKDILEYNYLTCKMRIYPDDIDK